MSGDLPARVTGMAIDTETTVDHLRTVGCVVRETGVGTLGVTPPPWRHDMTDPYDLVEEVARIVGYTEVPSVLPSAPAGRGLTKAQRLRRRVGFALAGRGLVEVTTYPFVGPADFDRLGLAPDDVLRRTVQIANPLSAERASLATTLLPGLLETTARNVSRGAASVGIFETALVFFPTKEGTKAPILRVDRRPGDAELAELMAAVPDQPEFLAVVLTGEREASGWWGPGRAAIWADVIEMVREVGRVLGVEVETVQATRAPWHPGRCAEIRVGGREVGHAGELHPGVCQAYAVPPRSCAVEIDLDALIAAAPDTVAGPDFSTFPVAKEDVALVVDGQEPSAAVAQTLREGAGELLESVRLFDVYVGDQIPEGKKSLAFSLRFRAPDRTLTDSEIKQARDAAVARAAERHDARLRS
jgi:phenylalanyl-tRNA synthetase beta chain